jgi:hypothetical protein
LKLFSRNNEPSDPATIINNCLIAVVNRISDSLDEEEYHWTKPWGVKRFESIILAKFMLDYSFNKLAEDKLGDDERTGYHNLCDISFSNLFNDEFSSVGLNYEDMQEEIQAKVDSYFEARRDSKPPFCWHAIYQIITRTSSKSQIQEDIVKKTAGLELIRGNDNFSSMVPQYEMQIKILKDKANSFESAEMMLPHMLRFTKDKLRVIKLKKIKAISKKLAKQEKSKK